MADTVAQHRYEVGSEGYSKLADSAQESLSNTLAMVASSSTQQEIIVQQMLANVSAQYQSAYDLIQQKIDETGTVISNTAEKQMQVNGEVNDYLDQMVAKSDQLKIAWDNYVIAVTPSGQTLEQALTGFITLIDSGTRHPKENWEAFVEAVGGTISTEAFQVFCDTISQGIATETTEWNNFKSTIGGQIDDTIIRGLFDYISEKTGTSITNWEDLQTAINSGEFTNEQLNELLSHISDTTNGLITNWEAFESVINGETPITGTVVDEALNAVQQKIDNIKKTWGEVINETTGESKEGVDKAQTAEDAKPAGQDVNTNEIPMDLTSSGKTVDQAAIDRENARKAAEAEAARRAELERKRAEVNNQRAELNNQINQKQQSIANNKVLIENHKKEADKNEKFRQDNVEKMRKADTKKKKDKFADTARFHRDERDANLADVQNLTNLNIQLEKEIDAIREQINSLPSYKVGTKRTLEDELALTHDKEIILGNGTVLRQLPQGSQVLPKIQADNIWKWSKIDPLKDMGKGIGATASVNTINNTGNNFYYDSLIHIDGNVDADVMDRLEDFGKALINNRNFQKNLTNVVTKEFVREGRKLGYK